MQQTVGKLPISKHNQTYNVNHSDLFIEGL